MQGLTISKHFGCFDMWSSEMNSQDFWGDYLHYTSFMVRSLFHLHWHVKSLGTHETCRMKKHIVHHVTLVLADELHKPCGPAWPRSSGARILGLTDPTALRNTSFLELELPR